MFKSDGDWDLDEDFLNDIDEKATQFYSQKDLNPENQPTKRLKVENHNCVPSTSSKQTAISNVTKNKGGIAAESDANRISRTNLILQMFQKDGSEESQPRTRNNNAQEKLTACDTSSNSDSSHLSYQKSENLGRKRMVLGILKNQNDETNIKNIRQETGMNSVINFSASSKNLIEKDAKSSHSKVRSASEKISKQVENKQMSKSQINEASRKKLILDTLAQYTANEKAENQNAVGKNQGIYKLPRNNEKVTIVRKFPGPAGLLPDKFDGSALPLAYLNSLEENEKKESTETSDSKLTEFCSQNTIDLFTEGAWQFMLNDLPPDFLKGHEIANIKHKANSNHVKSTKVQFLAGIIESIDHNQDNPSIILKDFTDTIEGIVHQDIPIKYPGILEPNAVILLHNVGMLKISGSLFTSKYHILVSPSSLLGIYTNNGNVIRTPHMKNLFDIRFHEKAEKNTLRRINVNCNSSSETNIERKNATVSSGSVFSKEIFNDDDSINLDNIDTFSFPLDEVTNSQTVKKFSCPAINKNSDLREVSSENRDITSKGTLLQKLKEKKYSANPKKLNDTLDSLNSGSVKISTFITSLDPNRSFELRHTNTQDNCIINSKIDCQVNLPSRGKNIKEICKGSTSNVKSKLEHFKNNKVLTPPEPQDLHSNSSSTSMKSNSTSFKRNSSELTLCCDSGDSDDEILSQLDVDTFV